MGKKIVVDVTEVGVPIEVKIGLFLIGIGGVNIAGAWLLMLFSIPHKGDLNDFIGSILMFLFIIFGIIYNGSIAWSGITLSERVYESGYHKEDLGTLVGFNIFAGFICSLFIFAGRLDMGIPAIIGLILTVIGALLVYSK
jgi:hypothetical protein